MPKPPSAINAPLIIASVRCFIGDARTLERISGVRTRRCPGRTRATHSGLIGFRHVFATFRATATRLRAFVHVADLLATPCTGVAYLGACRADSVMQGRITQHEVGGGLANLGTIDHQPEMLFFDMFAACTQAIRQRHLQANVVTRFTCFDTFLHVGILRNLMGHCSLLQESSKADACRRKK